MSKVALFGAAGAIGQSIAAALSAKGQPYRVVGRSRSALQAAFGHDPLVEIVAVEPRRCGIGSRCGRGYRDIDLPGWR